jgi:hypothetical protein
MNLPVKSQPLFAASMGLALSALRGTCEDD